jgi:predicted ester cyclase
MNVAPRCLVERFYYEVWNRSDDRVAREILHVHFRFRASLGPLLSGPQGFIDYMGSVHAALGDYRCIIEDVVEAGLRAAARMCFTGIHRGPFFGVPASGKRISWAGAAFFTTDGQQITDLWVLGDVDAVKRQLNADPASAFAP